MTKKELKSYLGMLGYYRRFVPGFSSIALPLTRVTTLKSPSKLNWTQPMEHAFNMLRDTLCKHTQLTIPSPETRLQMLQDRELVPFSVLPDLVSIFQWRISAEN